MTTAGESHGPKVLSLVEGVPAGLLINLEAINHELDRRQGGYGRGGRQKIESDRVDITAGIRGGYSTGAPIVLEIINKDSRLEDPIKTPPVHRPRPGHADFAGAVKFNTNDCRNILERASARETSARTAAGCIGTQILNLLMIKSFGFVRKIGGVCSEFQLPTFPCDREIKLLRDQRDLSEVYTLGCNENEKMICRIKEAKRSKDTVGGEVEVHLFNLPVGIGSCDQWKNKLDSRIAAAVMGVQGIKAVEIGIGVNAGNLFGTQVHDEFEVAESLSESNSSNEEIFARKTNRAGGIEGGMTNGMPLVVRATMKPISTIPRGLQSVDLRSGSPETSDYERSDTCAVPAASVILENVICFEVARALLEGVGGETVNDLKANYIQRASARMNIIG